MLFTIFKVLEGWNFYHPFLLEKRTYLKELTAIEKKFFDLISSTIYGNDISIYDLEYLETKNTLRVYIYNDKTLNATLDDCVMVDRLLSEPFEREEWILDSIVLEVSSPGIYRHLNTKKHFQMAKNSKIKLTLKEALKDENLPKEYLGQKKITGKIIEADDDKISLDLADGIIVNIKYDSIRNANLNEDL